MEGPVAFELRDARVEFTGRVALDGTTLGIAPGESVALIGPSGAGKTTVLRLCNAAIHPTSGSVRVDGLDLAHASPSELRRVRSSIGFVHQDLCLVPNLRVSQNVLLGRLGRQSFAASLRSFLWPRPSELERAHALLERVGIGERLFERTDALSGGQRQRTAIARALYQEPRALLADEPVSSVDPARARDTIALLRDLSAEHGLTLVVSLHDLALARAFFPRLVGLRAGRIEFDRPTERVSDDDFAALYALDPRVTEPDEAR